MDPKDLKYIPHFSIQVQYCTGVMGFSLKTPNNSFHPGSFIYLIGLPIVKEHQHSLACAMYYSSDLLCLKGGKFGAIWILGITKSDRGKEKDLPGSKVHSVDISSTSKALLDLLPIGSNHISLFLASTLSLGTVKCFELQVRNNFRLLILWFVIFCKKKL